jgi:preprotein translocase subunit SecD
MLKLIVVASLFAFVANAEEPVKKHVFEMRPVVEKASPDSERISVGTPPVAVNVFKTTLIDETALKSATARITRQGFPVIYLAFTPEGAKWFGSVTGQNVGKRIAILIDGHVYCAPKIASPITNGKAEVVGFSNEAEAIKSAQKINDAISKH